MTQRDALALVRRGRPVGTSQQQQLARQLVAQGIDAIEACRRAGYSNPVREAKRNAHAFAQAAHPTDELAVLADVAQFGPTSAAIAACKAILDSAPAETLKVNTVNTVIDVSELGWSADKIETFAAKHRVRIYKLPYEMTQALVAYQRVLAAPVSPPDDGSSCAVARRVLREIVARRSERAADHVRAAKLLLSTHLQQVERHATRYYFYIPHNGMVPVSAYLNGNTLWVDGSNCKTGGHALLTEYADQYGHPQSWAATDWSFLEREKALPPGDVGLLTTGSEKSLALTNGDDND